MTDHKFTDDEVIHHLDCYENLGYRWCGYAIALINRQKAEIERLKDGRDYIPANAAQALKEHAVAEAIKEFAERMKQLNAEKDFADVDKWGLIYVVDEKYRNAIDTLVKEMTE